MGMGGEATWRLLTFWPQVSHHLKIVTPLKLLKKIFLWAEAKHGKIPAPGMLTFSP
jgi:hypothetical protein